MNIMDLATGLDTAWVLLGAALVFFMQAGFAMVETGFTRAKNAGNIIMKNLMDFSLGTPIFWILGFGIMFGANVFGGWLSVPSFFQGANALPGDYNFATLIFQTVFCATAATIVSGAMAERTKFSAYIVYSMVISAVIYPVSGHWVWGGGWLSELGFHDFAGSTAVHMVGGVAALVGAKILGPRIGKYKKDGTSVAIPGHSLTLGALGVFILWFCWFGFNGCSTVAMSDTESSSLAASVFVTTNLAAACATVATMVVTWVRYKKPDVSMTLNGALAGLVAITAGCDSVTPLGAAVIGTVAGILVVFAVEFIDKKLKIDDPVGAVAVHGCCGAAGTIMTGLFAAKGGLFYGGGFSFLGIQTLGVITVIAWVAVTMTIVFLIIKHTMGLRASAEEEIEGLDIHEHGLASSYADFMLNVPTILTGRSETVGQETPESAVPIIRVPDNTEKKVDKDGHTITKITVVCKESKFEALKHALNEIGVTGMTLTHVLGCGMQKGSSEYYRGVPVEATLLPKIKVDIVVCRVPVSDVIKSAVKILYTGHIGDGKIFVYDVRDVVKVRTGESGYDAMTDDGENC